MLTIQKTSDSASVTSAAAVVLIVPDPARRASVARMLAGLNVPVVRECTTYPDSRYLDELMALDGDVFVVDLDGDVEQALSLIENICGRETPTTVMAISASNDPGLLIRSMRAGAREFLPGTLLSSTILDALGRTMNRLEKNSQHAAGKVLVFAGAKGGSGVTTVATNFAVALTKENAGKVVLVDMDVQLGEVALGLGLTPQFSILDALRNEERLDKDFLMTLLARHTSGLAVLASPEQYTSYNPPSSGLLRLFSILRHEFAFVVVDAGTAAGGTEETLLDLADTVYLVTEVSIPALRNARRLMSFIAGRDRNPHLAHGRGFRAPPDRSGHGAPGMDGDRAGDPIAPTGVEAETLAKAALLSGPGEADRWLAGGGVVVLDSGEVVLHGTLAHELEASAA